MEPILKYFIAPLVAAILTGIVFLAREIISEKRKDIKQLRLEKIVELYNKLYIIKLKYYDLLEIQYREEVYMVIEETGEEKTLEEPYINDFGLWDKAIGEATELVHEKIHLLEYQDLLIWHEIETADQEEIYTERAVYNKYFTFKRFLKSCSKTYGKLYNQYHHRDSQRKKERKERIKNNILLTKINPFKSEAERKRKLKRLRKAKKGN